MATKESVKEISSKEFSSFMEKNQFTVVDFYAEWCMPCLMMAPIMETMAGKYKKVKFAKINLDEAEELAEKFGVSSVPCIILFKDGAEIDRINGSASEEEIEEKIEDYLKTE